MGLGRNAISAPTSHIRRSCSATRCLLKAYRRLQPGLNPDLEMTAFLSEEAEFPAVPASAGYAEVVLRQGEPTTVAMLEEFVADGADAFESIAGMLDRLADVARAR